MTLEQRPEGGRKPEDTWGRRVPGGGNRAHAGTCQGAREREPGGKDVSPETILWG